ncbi:Esterase/Lipase [Favolaschia claudopus]|uniref:Esterase/Lipase n=1 Tax=Favolaschia claudopus TaxID=2862362 RepID=A0AAW0BZJ4_9AGAR
MESTRFKQLKTQRGFTYSYFWSASSTSDKPVILFSHGFPSGSSMWRKQVPFFERLGYGLLVPDHLGYGNTDKPTDPNIYTGSGFAQDIVDILDTEGVKHVVAVDHDWGALPVSRLINYYPQRVSACVFLGGGYMASYAEGSHFLAHSAMTIEKFGYDAYAYMRFFVRPDAAEIIEKNIDAFIGLTHPKTKQLLEDHLCVEGGARAYIESNTVTELPAYMSQEDTEHLRTALLSGGMSAPLCWYKAMAEQVYAKDDAKISGAAAYIHQPLLFVAFPDDLLAVPSMGDAVHAKYAKGPVTRKELIGAAHCGAESHPDELNDILLEWLRSLE